MLEYRLDPSWRQPPLGGAQLVTTVLLQHLYPSFYELLVSEDPATNPISAFLDYVLVSEMLPDDSADRNDPRWETCRRVFRQYRLQWPDTVPPPAGLLAAELDKLGKKIPAGFPELAVNASFVRLLRRVADAGSARPLHAQLRHRPLSTAPAPEVPDFAGAGSPAKVTYQGSIRVAGAR